MLSLAELLVAVFHQENKETTLQIRKLIAHVYKKKQIYQPRQGKSLLFYTGQMTTARTQGGAESKATHSEETEL